MGCPDSLFKYSHTNVVSTFTVTTMCGTSKNVTVKWGARIFSAIVKIHIFEIVQLKIYLQGYFVFIVTDCLRTLKIPEITVT